jgi:hypothetical protein
MKSLQVLQVPGAGEHRLPPLGVVARRAAAFNGRCHENSELKNAWVTQDRRLAAAYCSCYVLYCGNQNPKSIFCFFLLRFSENVVNAD